MSDYSRDSLEVLSVFWVLSEETIEKIIDYRMRKDKQLNLSDLDKK